MTLEHLIARAEVEVLKKSVAGFGEFFLDRITVGHVEAWRTGIAELGSRDRLRPLSIRPLRRSGPNTDILWADAKLLVRRRHTR